MAHEIAIVNGQNAMAYVGETPWHGLGQKLDQKAPIDVWAKAAGMDMHLAELPVQNGSVIVPDKKIIYRTDTNEGLSVVGDRYKVVQPIEVLEFFKEYVGDQAQLETAGVLKKGKVYWALARLDGEINIAGDVTLPYLMLSSSCDGSRATSARMTSVRVVCNNTLSMAYRGQADVSIRHNSHFNANEMHRQLQDQYVSLKSYAASLKALAKMKVTDSWAENFLKKVIDGSTETNLDEVKASRTTAKILDLFRGQGKGATSTAAKGTAFGLLNGVTEYYDWQAGRTQDARLEQAWFGRAADLKVKVMAELLQAA